MIFSMTGFAAAEGQLDPFSWSWDVRSVNGRGLDLRVRVPDWIDGLEAALRKRLGGALGRGNVTVNLRLTRVSEEAALKVNAAVLESVLSAIGTVESAAMAQGQSLAPATAADVLALRGVLETGDTASTSEEIAALRGALLEDFEDVLAAFIAARQSEGAALSDMLSTHLDEIARLTDAATQAAEARQGTAEAQLTSALRRVTSAVEDMPQERIVQELALLAVKADVTEEINRLGAHIAAARDLMIKGGPVGRRFDFLMQEFNREANTLCSKSGDAALTAIGLELKTQIDQLREQVQNVE
ncbi:YicC/YloC family endoribonuclease [Primorskyibacter sp. S187A]|uniref:YicC/YloC family endoribonuclease n=1 Tax=Primorskyibacter sp. S187A TaxID=3415130 RepID=UPI003C7C2CBE